MSYTASGLRTSFLSENPNELCDKLKLLLLEKRAGNNSNKNKHKEIVALITKLLEHKCVSPSQYEKIKKNSILCKMCDYIS